jgi:protein-L-isoaspartate(D-aspartate) O-methyltransferase
VRVEKACTERKTARVSSFAADRHPRSSSKIGTGLGYQAAILAQLAGKVYEIVEELGRQAKRRLRRHGCTNVEVEIANGYRGWSDRGPFDKVIMTAAPGLIPPPLIQQQKAGGKLVIPAGLPDAQTLILVEKPGKGGVTTKEIPRLRLSAEAAA